MLSGCAGPLSTLEPSGPAAASIAGLWWVMLAGSAILFAMVLVLFLLTVFRPGWGSRMSPARWIVLGGVVLPADSRDKRCDQVGDDRRNDGGECGANDHGDRKLDEVAPGDEVSEALHVHDPLCE